MPVWDLLATALGKTSAEVQALSEKGKLGRKEMQLLFDAMGKRAAGASEKMARTWAGLMGRMGDKWEGFKKLIADGGFFDDAKRLLERFMSDLDRSFRDGRAARAAKALGDVLNGVLRVVSALARQTAAHVRYIIDNFDTLKPYIYGVAAAFGVLAAATYPVWTALLGLGIVLDDILTYLEGGKSVFGDFIQWMRDLTGMPEALAQAFAALGGTLVTFLGLGFLALLPGIVAKIALAFALAFGSAIAAVTAPFMAAFVGLFAFLLTPAGWAVIIAGIGAALIAYFWDDIVAAAPKLVSAGAEMGKALLEGIKSMGGAIADWFAGLVPDWAKGFFSGGVEAPARPKGSEAPSPNLAPGDVPTPGQIYRGRYGSREMNNFDGNIAKMSAPNSSAAVVTDNSQDNRSYPVTVNAPITQNITQATQAPAAAASGVKGAINQAAQGAPARMRQGPVQ